MQKKKPYINYDYEAVYSEEVKAEDERIKHLLRAGEIKSVYATKTIRSGKQFEVEIYPEFTRKEADELRIKKESTTVQKNLNDRNARKRLERTINANFGSGDYWLTLTYKNGSLPDSIEAAQKDMKNYIARINYRRKKEDKPPAKYVYITEYGEKTGRCHHHLIIDQGTDMETLEAIWKKGTRNNVRRITEDENGLIGLASYLSKDPKGKKRWKSSKGLKKPKESKSYSAFKHKKVRKMVENQNIIPEVLEKKYKKRFLSAEVRYNEHNGRFYIYARMVARE